MGKWTKFFDLSSGGGDKTEFPVIAVEGDEQSACELFQETFDRDPRNVTCECCGSDYSITEFDSLESLLEIYPDAHQVPSKQNTK